MVTEEARLIKEEEVKEEYYTFSESVGTSLTKVVENVIIPQGYFCPWIEIAVDNTVSGKIDVKVGGKSIFTEPLLTAAFPSNKKPVKIYIPQHLEPTGQKKMDVYAAGVGGTVTVVGFVRFHFEREG